MSHLASLCASLLLLAPAAGPAPAGAPPAVQDDAAGDFPARLEKARGDVAALRELLAWCRLHERAADAQEVANAILALDEADGPAHEALGHHLYDGRWFESYSALSAYRREEDARMLREQGVVRFRDGWARPEDIPFLRMGWVRSPAGEWLHPAEQKRRADAERLAGAGWQQQDLTWIPPAEFDRWRQGLWKCGDQWLEDAAAHTYHAEIGRWWQVPGKFFVALSTCPRKSAEWAAWWADQTWPDLVRAYGVQPRGKPEIVVLKSLAQYNTFAAGDQAAGLAPSEVSGASSAHYAFLADSWFDRSAPPPRWRGTGVAYWDETDPKVAPYGQHAVRHAAAEAYAEAIDPSWNTVSLAVEGGAQQVDVEAFWREKRIPRWLRAGVASYCERFFRDPNVGDGGDPLWARTWALENLKAAGGLAPLPQVFGHRPDPNDPAGSARRLHSAGLVVAFVLDGGCKPVEEAHAAFVEALRGGGATAEAARALEQAITAHEAELKAFAGI